MTPFRMFKIRQKLPRPRVENVGEAVRRGVNRLISGSNLSRGSQVAITAGSRGISDLDLVMETAIQVLQEAGCRPFLVAAMGSHGGGKAEGQLAILRSLGLSQEPLGVPVLAGADLREVGRTVSGYPVYCDPAAWQADGILVINRIKAHTACQGPVQSGLLKMMAVGLGKEKGARLIHRQGGNMSAAITEIGRFFIEQGPLLGGLALVENSYGELSDLVAVKPSELEEQERRLLTRAKQLHPRLPVEELDLLIVDEMGKDYSGTGIDTNVIGRRRIIGHPEPASPRVLRLAVLALSEASGGNATGIGLADFTTRQLVEKIDYQKTYYNCLTSGYVQRAMIPLVFNSHRALVEAAINSLHLGDPSRIRAIRIPNTLHLEQIWASEALFADLGSRPEIEVLTGFCEIQYDLSGNFSNFELQSDPYS